MQTVANYSNHSLNLPLTRSVLSEMETEATRVLVRVTLVIVHIIIILVELVVAAILTILIAKASELLRLAPT